MDLKKESCKYEDEFSNMTWSFSRINSYEMCPYSWYLTYIEHAPEIDNFYSAYGTLCHEILEKGFKNGIIFNGSVQNSALCEYINRYFTEVSPYTNNPSTKMKYFNSGCDFFKSDLSNWLSGFEILGVEKEAKFKIGKNNFIGYIDLLVRDVQTGKIVIVDHKTSEFPLLSNGGIKKSLLEKEKSYELQMYLYSAYVKEKYGKFPSILCWNYTRYNKRYAIPFKIDDYNAALEHTDRIIETIKTDTNFSENMNWFYCNKLCGHRNDCLYRRMMEESNV